VRETARQTNKIGIYSQTVDLDVAGSNPVTHPMFSITYQRSVATPVATWQQLTLACSPSPPPVDRPAVAQQLHSTWTPVGGEAMGAVRPALTIHHALGCELAVLAVERTKMDGQGGTGLVLPPQTQLHQLGTCGAPAHRIVLGMHVHEHARGEIRDLLCSRTIAATALVSSTLPGGARRWYRLSIRNLPSVMHQLTCTTVGKLKKFAHL